MTLSRLTTYGKGFQIKVLGSLLTDKTFLLTVRDVLKADYFDSDAHKWIVEETAGYFDEYHTTITMEVLKTKVLKVTNDVLKVAIKEELRNAYSALSDDQEYIQKEFTSFCKNQDLKKALLESAELLKTGEYDSIRSRIEAALKAGMDKGIGHEYNKDVESRYRADYRPTIPTPWPIFNSLIQGGMGPGDLILLFGSPGAGKSWLAVAIGAHAVLLGYNVNYYTLELGEDYVGKRFDCYFTGHSIDQVNDYRGEVETIVEGLKGNLIVKEYPPKQASMTTIESHLQKCKDMGHEADLVIIDYIDYLKAPSRKYGERKDELDDMYIAGKGLAKKYKIPVLSPSQVNRAGAKDSIIEGDKAAGSYDKMMVADICLSLSRQKEDKIQGTGRLHVMKNRYGSDGITYDVEMDTNNGRTVFKKEVSLEDMIEQTAAPVNAVTRKFFSLEGGSQ